MFPIKIIEDPECDSKWFVNAKNISPVRYSNTVSVNAMKQFFKKKHFIDASSVTFLNIVISMFSNTMDGHSMARYQRDVIRKPTYEEYCLLERYLRSNKLQYNKQTDELIQLT